MTAYENKVDDFATCYHESWRLLHLIEVSEEETRRIIARSRQAIATSNIARHRLASHLDPLSVPVVEQEDTHAGQECH